MEEWEDLADLPQAMSRPGIVFVGDRLYVAYQKTLLEYDFRRDRWKSRADIPDRIFQGQAVVAVDDKILAFQGNKCIPMEYCTRTDEWTVLEQLSITQVKGYFSIMAAFIWKANIVICHSDSYQMLVTDPRNMESSRCDETVTLNKSFTWAFLMECSQNCSHSK
jgi:hypothetical protein